MRPTDRPWTVQDLDTLKREFPNRKTKEVAAILGRSTQAVAVMAHKKGLVKYRKGIVWTSRMLKLLADYFPTMFNKPLARWIGVSERTLIRKARELGIDKAEGFLDTRRADITELAADALRRGYRSGRIKGGFQKGVHSNPAGEFKHGHVESPETKAKRSASLRRTFAKKRNQTRYY